MRRLIIAVLVFATLIIPSVAATATIENPEKIDVLILPKFENGEMGGDFPGEAQYYYENYLEGGEEYEIAGGYPGHKLYVKDGVALYVTGMGKVNSSMSTTAVILDPRFDFSDAYVISTGCGGTATEYTVMGDVFVMSACADYDLGHHADPRDMTIPSETTWFHDSGYDDASFKLLNQDLVAKVYDLVKDVEIETTEKTRNFMIAAFPGEDWAARDPEVLLGTTVSGDNYWKGEYDEANARLMTETYGAPDPYAMSEMEDAAIAVALDRLGMLDRYIIIRDSVNMDVFMNGTNPEYLWAGIEDSLSSEDSVEAADIFAVAMENNYKVGSVVVDAILDGTL